MLSLQTRPEPAVVGRGFRGRGEGGRPVHQSQQGGRSMHQSEQGGRSMHQSEQGGRFAAISTHQSQRPLGYFVTRVFHGWSADFFLIFLILIF